LSDTSAAAGPDRQHVEVEIGRALAIGKVDIADVAPADHGRDAIHRHRLVVHPPVQAEEVEGVGQQLGAAHRERVEDADLDVLHRIKGGQHVVEAGDAVVVEQEPDADAPFGRGAQLVEQKPAGRIHLPDVILDIDAFLRRARQQDAGGQRIAAVGQRHHPAQALVPGHQRQDRRPELGVGAGRDGGRGLSVRQIGQRMGQAQHHHGQHQHNDDFQKRPQKPHAPLPTWIDLHPM
jgi:hypothetical protein